MKPAVYIDFVGVIVDIYGYDAALEVAIRSTSVDPEKCKDPKKLALLDKEYTRLILADPASRLRSNSTMDVLRALELKGFKRVVWTFEDAYTVGEILKREEIRVDRIDSLTGYGIPTTAGVEYVYEAFENNLNKAELLRMTEYSPTIVVDHDLKALEHCKRSGRSDIEIFLCILENPDDTGKRKTFEDKRKELGLEVKLFFSRTIDGLINIMRYVSR